jgi:hypothetical protein
MSTGIDTTAVASTTPARRRRIPPMAYGVLVIAVFAGIIGIASVAGAFQTSGRTPTGEGRQPLAGESTTEVKGWMAIGEVADAFGVPLADVLAAFELPSDTPPETALKDLESDLFSVAALRDWLEAHGSATP